MQKRESVYKTDESECSKQKSECGKGNLNVEKEI